MFEHEPSFSPEPMTLPPEVKPTSFKSAEYALAGRIYYPERREADLLPSTLIYHGFRGNQERYVGRAQVLNSLGLVSYTFDFRGCGASEGQVAEQTPGGNVEDGLAAYDNLQAQPQIDPDRINIYATSLGGYAAAVVAKDRPVHTLVLISPALYHNDWWNTPLPQIPQAELTKYRQEGDLTENRALQAIATFPGNLLVVQHESDTIVPARATQAYYDQAQAARSKQLAVIPRAPHSIKEPDQQQLEQEIILKFLKETAA